MENKQNKTTATHIDATLLPRSVYVQAKMVDQSIAKQMIAEHVTSNYVKDFDAVLLDAGSTAEMIATELFARRRFLSVLTNNMGAYAAFTRAKLAVSGETYLAENGNELLISGGRYDDTYEALFGEGAISSIADFTPNVIIIDVDGLRVEEGVFCHGAEEAAVKTMLLTKPTDIRLIAADWTKIGKRDAHPFGRVEQLGVNTRQAILVTSSPPREAYDTDPERVQAFENQVRRIEQHNIQVVQVKAPQYDQSQRLFGEGIGPR